MKKILISLALIFGIMFPIKINADTQALDLIDTLESENIVLKYDKYQENDDQITIYLFRGEGCTHCRDFLEFLNDIAEEFGNKFKLRSFEVYYNSDNQKLKEKVIKFFDVEAEGVPFIVIGESTFYGFNESYENKIKKVITEEYNALEKYDVFEKMEQKESEKNPNDALIIIIPLIGAIIIYFIIKSVKKDLD